MMRVGVCSTQKGWPATLASHARSDGNKRRMKTHLSSFFNLYAALRDLPFKDVACPLLELTK